MDKIVDQENVKRAQVNGPSTHDPVSKPTHYRSHPSGVECIEVTRHMGFNVGNAMKYLWRAGMKGSTVEDLKKAMWYIADELERLAPYTENICAQVVKGSLASDKKLHVPGGPGGEGRVGSYSARLATEEVSRGGGMARPSYEGRELRTAPQDSQQFDSRDLAGAVDGGCIPKTTERLGQVCGPIKRLRDDIS